MKDRSAIVERERLTLPSRPHHDGAGAPWLWLVVAALVLGASPPPLPAQSTPPAGDASAMESRLERLERENAELRRRVDVLERERGTAAASTRAESVARPEREPSVTAGREAHGISLRSGPIAGIFQFFGNAGFGYDNPRPHDASNASFFMGSFDLFSSLQIGERFNALAESVFETDSHETTTDFELERLWGSWTANDLLSVKLGREHSPISRWDRKFHHGHFLWPAVTQPFLARFEDHGGPLPVHAVGVEFGGRLLMPSGLVEYVTGVSNGRAKRPNEVQDVVDDNGAKAYELTLSFAPSFLPYLVVGESFYADEIPAIDDDPTRSHAMRELIGTAFVDYERGSFQLLAEGGVIAHRDRTRDRSFHHGSGYVQLAYGFERLTPFTRFDWRAMARGDPYFTPEDLDLDQLEYLIGLHYRLNEFAKVSLEGGLGRGERRRESGAVERRTLSRMALSLSWAF